MKIARLLGSNMETYGFVNGNSVITKEEITQQTGIPIPQNIKDFLFDGWYDEIKHKMFKLNYPQKISSFKILAP
ncbi:MAG: FAA hydrolase family protein, partial [Nitrosopumilaceae archaeon]